MICDIEPVQTVENSKRKRMFTCHRLPSKISISQAFYMGFS